MEVSTRGVCCERNQRNKKKKSRWCHSFIRMTVEIFIEVSCHCDDGINLAKLRADSFAGLYLRGREGRLLPFSKLNQYVGLLVCNKR